MKLFFIPITRYINHFPLRHTWIFFIISSVSIVLDWSLSITSSTAMSVTSLFAHWWIALPQSEAENYVDMLKALFYIFFPPPFKLWSYFYGLYSLDQPTIALLLNNKTKQNLLQMTTYFSAIVWQLTTLKHNNFAI